MEKKREKKWEKREEIRKGYGTAKTAREAKLCVCMCYEV